MRRTNGGVSWGGGCRVGVIGEISLGNRTGVFDEWMNDEYVRYGLWFGSWICGRRDREPSGVRTSSVVR